jgi:predicted transport protein
MKENAKLRYPKEREYVEKYLFLNNRQVLALVSQEVAKQFNANYVASKFTQISFNQLNISNIDRKFGDIMISLEELCVTGNKITEISNLPNSIKNLNAYGNSIATIELGKAHSSIQCIGVGYNRISDISFVNCTPNLLSLDLSYNDITDLKSTILAIRQIRTIKVLSLHGNSICLLPQYRTAILANIQTLISLDDKSISIEEKKAAPTLFAGFDRDDLTIKISVHTIFGLPISEEEKEKESLSRMSTPAKGKATAKTPAKKELAKGKNTQPVAPPEPTIKERTVYSVEYDWMSYVSMKRVSTNHTKSVEGKVTLNHEKEFVYTHPTLAIRDHLISN